MGSKYDEKFRDSLFNQKILPEEYVNAMEPDYIATWITLHELMERTGMSLEEVEERVDNGQLKTEYQNETLMFNSMDMEFIKYAADMVKRMDEKGGLIIDSLATAYLKDGRAANV